MKKILQVFVAVMICLTSTTSFAQGASSGGIGVRRGLAVMMFSGLAGAVIGLSTLSFYGEPQEHIGNIWTGLAVGAGLGGAYLFSQSSKSTSAFEISRPTNPHQVARTSQPLVQYQFDF